MNTALKAIAAGTIAILFASAPAFAQSYSIDWFRISGGGGTSTNAQFSLSGTIGQAEAGVALTNSTLSLVGGFWAINAIQTVGAPLLSIAISTNNTYIVSWPASASGFILQQNSDLTTTNWVNITNSTNSVGGQNLVLFSAPTRNQFYRLVNP